MLDRQYSFINFTKEDSRREAFLAVNPCSKVSALVDNNLVITESAVIVLHLAEKYGANQLLPPAGSDASTLHHQWVILSFVSLNNRFGILASISLHCLRK